MNLPVRSVPCRRLARYLPMSTISTTDARSLASAQLGAEASTLAPRNEEPLNALTHGLGLLLSVGGAWWLCDEAVQAGGFTRIASCGVYAASLVIVYLFSTLSHLVESPQPKRVLRIFDQAFIYFLIVGTYTPIAIAYLPGVLNTVLLSTMWGVAILGFLSKTVVRHRIDSLSTASYLLLGWLPALSAPSAWLHMPMPAIQLFVAGGLCYTVGVPFLLYDTRVRYFHTVWHLLVIAGSAFHFAAILRFVALPVVG
ncbi:MAG: hemolysin III [Pirellula sp.]|nr:hemolysin III [Pirellula sp.]